MIQLTEILDQGSLGDCDTCAFGNLATALLKLKGIDDKIDPIALFNVVQRNGGSSPFAIITYGLTQGFPAVSGKSYKLTGCQPIRQTIPDIKAGLQKYGGLVLAFSLHNQNFDDRFDKNWNLQRPNDGHAVIIVEDQPDKNRFKCANSWGPNWPIDPETGRHGDGYFYIDYGYICGRDFEYFLGISL